MVSVPDRAWCPECRRSREIEDQFLEDTGDSRPTVEEFSVTVLSCGHTLERATRTYPSPLRQAGPRPNTRAVDPFAGES